MKPAALAALLLVAAACGGKSKPAAAPEPTVPARAATGAESLLAVLPAGAQVVFELDLARARANPNAGQLIAALGEAPEVVRDEEAMVALGQVLLQRADAAVLASYRVGADDAATLIAVRPPDALQGTTVVGGVGLIGPEAWIARARVVAAGAAPSVASDTRLMSVRAAAMPDKATAAVARLSGVLDFEARVELAARFELEVVPVTISVWGDLADDVALVAVLSGDEAGDGETYARAIDRTLERLRASTPLALLGLGNVLEGVKVSRGDRLAQMVALMSPKRFSLTTTRLVKWLRARRPAEPGL